MSALQGYHKGLVTIRVHVLKQYILGLAPRVTIADLRYRKGLGHRGPGTQLEYTLDLKYLYRGYFKSNVYTIP